MSGQKSFTTYQARKMKNKSLFKDKKIGLFVPCYIDQFYPGVAVATLELLESLGCKVIVPARQTCCGQPMANAGFQDMSEGCSENFIDNFKGLDAIVSPSGSCVLHVKEHLNGKDGAAAAYIRDNIYELSEFLTDVLEVESLSASFPFKVGLHMGCHGLRGLHLGAASECVIPAFSKPAKLLSMVKGLHLFHAHRPDECCGFGGTFCVTEAAVSAKMGKERVLDHLQNEVDYITSGDTSCLMHLEGVIRRLRLPLRVIHLAEILNTRNNG